MHILPRNFFHVSGPLWKDSSDFIATLVVFMGFGLATFVLIAIAPLSLLIIPIVFFPFVYECLDHKD